MTTSSPASTRLPTQSAISVEAGAFGAWLAQIQAALRGTRGSTVPCGDCTGCCTSGYSLQLRPEDRRALAVIPPELLHETAGFAAGQQTLPARPDGRCTMLIEGRCSIYADRPQTCLDYDCRIFAAAGIDAGGPDKAVINQRVHAWKFDYPTEHERQVHAAVQAAAQFLRGGSRSTHGIRLPATPMGIAVLAIKAHAEFMDVANDSRDEAALTRAVFEAARAFDADAQT